MTTTPTTVQPSDLASVTVGSPQLSAYVAYADGGVAESVFVTWQVASDAAFTTDLQSITTVEVAVSGQVVRGSVPTRLAPGTWYVRARSTDLAAVNSSWSATQSFVIAHKAYTSSHVPAASQRVAYGTGDITFSWEFADQDPIDSQSAYQVRAYFASDDTLLFDSTKTTSTDELHVETIGMANQSGYYYWQVKVWDADDNPGDWSTPILFHLSVEPTVVISAPTMAGVVDSPTPTITWAFISGNASPATYTAVDDAYATYTALDADNATYLDLLGISPDQANQEAWRVVIRAGLVVVHDSGWQTGNASTHTPGSPVLQLNTNYEVVVWVRDSGDFEGDSAPVIFSASWPAPDAPVDLIVDASATDTVGAVQISWNADAYDGSFVEWRVYHRKVDSDTGLPVGTWELVGTSLDQSGRAYVLDYLFEPNTTYQFAAVQAATRFGDVVESTYTYEVATPTSSHYWLICPDDTELNVRLQNVTNDSFAEEYERNIFNIINKGRRMEIGTRFGFAGSLSAHIRHDAELDLTASEQLVRLRSVIETRKSLMLRVPFGLAFVVGVGDISYDRVPGVGLQEYVNITIPYSEVAA
jgi:hypothetical protein